jgi:hypothetical protein
VNDTTLQGRARAAYEAHLAKVNGPVGALRERMIAKVADMFGCAVAIDGGFVNAGKDIPARVSWEGTRESWRPYGTLELEGVLLTLDGEGRRSADGATGVYLEDLFIVSSRAGKAEFVRVFGEEALEDALAPIESLAQLGKALDMLEKASRAFGFDPALERLLDEEEAIARRAVTA